jgi:hypothetical protein
MKSYLDEEAEDDEEEDLKAYTSLIFKAQSPTTKLQLLAALPQRTAMDLLVSRYFNSNSPALREFRRASELHHLLPFANALQLFCTGQHSKEM